MPNLTHNKETDPNAKNEPAVYSSGDDNFSRLTTNGRIQERELLPDIVGAIRHVGLWLYSESQDVNLKNLTFSPPEAPFNQGISIYCIHGTADRVSAFSILASQLLAKLPSLISSIKIVCFTRRFKGESIENFALELKNKILANKDQHVILIGHSRGGLVASYFSEYLAKEANINVHGILTVGTPFNGSDRALPPLTWISTSVKEMQTRSEFLTELNKRISESKTKYYHFAAEKDSLVSLNSSYIEDRNHSLILLKQEGHLSIMSSPALVEYFSDCIHEILKKLNLMNEETENDTYFAIIKTLCREITTEIKQLKERTHINNAIAKEFVLIKLKEILKKIEHNPLDNPYPESTTFGDLFTQFLNDQNIFKGVTPHKILSDQLNFPFTLFSNKKATSLLFIEGLIKLYGKIHLPENHEPIVLMSEKMQTS